MTKHVYWLKLGKNILYLLYFSKYVFYSLYFKNVYSDFLPFIKCALWPFCEVFCPYSPLAMHKLET